MKFSNRSACILLGFSLLTTSVFAVTTSNIPPIAPGFGLGLSGDFLKPDANNLVYAVHTKPLPLPDPNWTQEAIDTNYHPTFAVDFLYTFASQIDQVKLNWLYLSSSDSASASATGSDSVAPPYAFGPLAQQLRGSAADSKVRFKVNDVNFIYDHVFNIIDHLQLTPFVGIDTAYLKQDITSNFTGTSGGNPYSITSYNDSKYFGAGPRIGLDLTYYFLHGFGITSEMATSLLVGSMVTNTHFDSFGAGNTTPGYTGLANDLDQTRIVTQLEAKLGLTYLKSFHSKDMLIEAGYAFSTYLNGINQVVPTALVPAAFNNGVIAIETSQQQQSSLDLSGPYLKMTFMF